MRVSIQDTEPIDREGALALVQALHGTGQALVGRGGVSRDRVAHGRVSGGT